MYQQAVGFNPGSLLSGLSPKASQFAKGQAMQAASGLNMDREQKNQDFALKQMQDDSQQRQQAARNSAQAATNASQERTQRRQMDTQRAAFDVGMQFDYDALRKRQQLQLQQTLLNGLAKDF